MWTRFMDMHSGGGQKEAFAYCLIEAPEAEARAIFYNRFGHNPERVSCTCCGEDYSITEHETLEQATAYDRGCAYDQTTKRYEEVPDTRHGPKELVTLEAYCARKDVRVIRADEIETKERSADIPTQGYVWQD